MRQRRRENRRARRWALELSFENLEARELQATAVHGLGTFLPPKQVFTPPGTVAPRVGRAGLPVDPHRAVNRVLRSTLGPGTDRLTRAAELYRATERSPIAREVLGNAFIRGILSRNDVYSALNSQAVRGSLDFGGAQNVSDEIVVVAPPSTIGEVQNGSREVVISSGGTSGVRIVVSGAIPVVEVGNGTRVMRIPRTQLPPEAQSVLSASNRTNSRIFGRIGDDILKALETAEPTQAPETVDTVPGLRTVSLVKNSRLFPNPHQTPFLRFLRLAVDKNLFRLNSEQIQLVNDRLSQFFTTANDLYISGAFNTPDQEPISLPTDVLDGTLSVSFGALRQFFIDERVNLNGIPSVSGLNLPDISDLPGIVGFPGRYELGFVFDRQGNYGLAVSIRNSLENTAPGLQEANKISGEIAVEISNASSIKDLNGVRGAEGISLGSAVSGGVLATEGNGVSTVQASIGYGAGIEFGVGARLTQIIPLGNVLAPRYR